MHIFIFLTIYCISPCPPPPNMHFLYICCNQILIICEHHLKICISYVYNIHLWIVYTKVIIILKMHVLYNYSIIIRYIYGISKTKTDRRKIICRFILSAIFNSFVKNFAHYSSPFLITVTPPIYGTRTSGTVTLPSSFW